MGKKETMTRHRVSASENASKTNLNGKPSAIKYRDYLLQRRKALNNHSKVRYLLVMQMDIRLDPIRVKLSDQNVDE